MTEDWREESKRIAAEEAPKAPRLSEEGRAYLRALLAPQISPAVVEASRAATGGKPTDEDMKS